MLAEINNKLGGDNLNRSERMEDELTGNFFGTLRYISFNKGLKNVMRQAHTRDAAYWQLLENIDTEIFDFEFWKRAANGEIDAYVSANGIPIGIEVKYNSDLSGEDQLEREAIMLSQEWNPNEEAILLFVAKRERARNIYLENYQKDCFKHVHLAYLNWEDCLTGLEQAALEAESFFEELIIKDLKEYMYYKGFVNFAGFAQCCKETIAPELTFSFTEACNIWPKTMTQIDSALTWKI